MNDELDKLRDRIGELSVEALSRGGEALLTRVEAALGVAMRHSERIAKGILNFDDNVKREMVDSIQRAEHIVTTKELNSKTLGNRSPQGLDGAGE